MIIENWRKAPRMFSFWVGSAAVTFGLLPVDQQSAILALVGVPAERIPAALGALFLVARFTAQPAVKET